MTSSRIKRVLAVLALALPAAAAAQTPPPAPPYSASEAPAPEATGAPRRLPGLGSGMVAPAAPAPAVEQTTLPPEPASGSKGSGAITVSTLGNVEGAPAGTLGTAQGGLGEDLWSGTPRQTADDLMARLPIATPVAAVRDLARRIVLTRAAAPMGDAAEAFMTVRLKRLLDAGMLDSAADLAAMAKVDGDAGFARAQAEALLFAGRKDVVCTPATATRLASAEPFWIELRAYCYAMSGNDAALSLTRQIMQAQNIDDAAFDTLLDDLKRHVAKAPDNVAAPNALHAFLLGQLGLPVDYDVGSQIGTPGLVLAAQNAANSPEDRLKAAQMLLPAGAVPAGELAAIADAQHFTDDQFATEHATIAKLSFLGGQALLRQAVARAAPNAKPALIYQALEVGRAAGYLPVAAALQHDALAALAPTHDMRAMADLMGRALLLDGDADAAARWNNILDFSLPSDRPLIAKFQVLLNLVAPNPARQMAAETAYGELAKESLMPGQGQAFAALAVGLGIALSQPVPKDVIAQAAFNASMQWQGRRPAASLMARLTRAMAAPGRRGEALMLILNAIGPTGSGDLAPDVTIALVRDMVTLGVPDAARKIAIATLLLHKPAPPAAAKPPPA
ncbi:MAG: hypothetical protein KGR48_12990 [Alphaproteobacteria bacterium]|nr:hypothetical protein [Alphaproteobacteria bacterium]MBU6471283.1 hypothetical protein [Alphaproteobacteria bacterium]MDE2014630.1 hypothetical protein [Alphaproteobacteria bacterium]MDE2074670.1 hypothetical protein [Alphaproteobacteria bacterium]